jgi:glycosyltransferase involved in cell wall biosynthesis
MIIFIYIVIIFLIIRFSVTLFNFLSNPKLPLSVKHYSNMVSILVPVRNEEENILDLLESIKNQDYENYEVIVLDDSSTDNTFKIVEKFCAKNEKFIIISGAVLPNGWLGKNYACQQLSRIARGDYFLFLDADEIVKNGLLNSLIHRAENGKLALLSIFTNQITINIGEKLTVPLMHFILLNLLPLRLVKLSANPAFAAASGQCMFFNAEIYKQHQWHNLVKNKVVEDIEIMKLVKQTKLPAEALLANGLIYCRMYKNAKEAINGFSKNFLAGFDNNILIMVLYLLLVIIGPVVIILTLNINLIIISLALIFLSRIMISFLSGQNVIINLFLHPLQMIFFLVISVFSIKNHLFKTGTWKGRAINQI